MPASLLPGRYGAARGIQHPDVTLDCISMAQSMPLWDRGDYRAIRSILAESVRRIAAAGADFFVCPDHTAHMALEQAGEDFALPGLHIAKVVAEHAAHKGYQRIGVLGTKYLMGSWVYPNALAARDIAAEIPEEDERQVINDIIFRELVNGVFTKEAQEKYVRIIDKLQRCGCDAVALACTEIPLLITPEISPLPPLDSTRLLALAALDVATSRREMPQWRGGKP